MAARLLSRASRSLASSSSFFNRQPSHHHHRLPITASAFISSPNHHQRRPLFPMATRIRLFSSEPHHNPGSVTLTTIIHEHAEAGRTEEALDVYRRFIAAGIFLEYYTYNALIMALAADPNYVADAKD